MKISFLALFAYLLPSLSFLHPGTRWIGQNKVSLTKPFITLPVKGWEDEEYFEPNYQDKEAPNEFDRKGGIGVQEIPDFEFREVYSRNLLIISDYMTQVGEAMDKVKDPKNKDQMMELLNDIEVAKLIISRTTDIFPDLVLATNIVDSMIKDLEKLTKKGQKILDEDLNFKETKFEVKSFSTRMKISAIIGNLVSLQKQDDEIQDAIKLFVEENKDAAIPDWLFNGVVPDLIEFYRRSWNMDATKSNANIQGEIELDIKKAIKSTIVDLESREEKKQRERQKKLEDE